MEEENRLFKTRAEESAFCYRYEQLYRVLLRLYRRQLPLPALFVAEPGSLRIHPSVRVCLVDQPKESVAFPSCEDDWTFSMGVRRTSDGLQLRLRGALYESGFALLRLSEEAEPSCGIFEKLFLSREDLKRGLVTRCEVHCSGSAEGVPTTSFVANIHRLAPIHQHNCDNLSVLSGDSSKTSPQNCHVWTGALGAQWGSPSSLCFSDTVEGFNAPFGEKCFKSPPSVGRKEQPPKEAKIGVTIFHSPFAVSVHYNGAELQRINALQMLNWESAQGSAQSQVPSKFIQSDDSASSSCRPPLNQPRTLRDFLAERLCCSLDCLTNPSPPGFDGGVSSEEKKNPLLLEPPNVQQLKQAEQTAAEFFGRGFFRDARDLDLAEVPSAAFLFDSQAPPPPPPALLAENPAATAAPENPQKATNPSADQQGRSLRLPRSARLESACSRVSGPVGFDVAFAGALGVYGYFEHGTPFKLRNFSEPYR